MIDLSHQTVLIIGGLNALTTGAASALHQAGARLIVAYQPPLPTPDPLTALPMANTLEVTLSDPLVLAEEIAEFSFQTVLISPGWFAHTPFMQTTPDDIDAALKLNFEYSTYAAQATARRLIEQGDGGSIIFLTSVVSLTPFVHTNLAGSSLAALEVIAKMAAVDLGPYGIKVNLVAAGWVEGEWSRPLLTDAGQMHIETDIPVGSVGSPQSIGDACCFLASSLSDYITGAILPVDGGYLLTKSTGKTPYPPQG